MKMDKRYVIPTDAPLQKASSIQKLTDSEEGLTDYALYPDAGDFTDVHAAEDSWISLPESTAVYPIEKEPDFSMPEQNTVLGNVLSESAPSVPPSGKTVLFPRILVRYAAGGLTVIGVLVYAGLLIWDGRLFLESKIGQWAIGEMVGGLDRVAVLSEETLGSEILENGGTEEVSSDIPAAESAPPANEQKEVPPSSHVLTMDLSSKQPNGWGIINETPYSPNLNALAKTAPTIDSYAALESIYGKGTPAVLIIHTHGTESYSDTAEEGYHTAEAADSVRKVGAALAETLEKAGIGVIHCTELFDDPSFDMAYYNAAAYIRSTLEQYPSVRYILDVHRDAITAEDGTGIRPLTVVEGTEYAQMMFVVGTDHGGSGHVGWENNLALAVRLQTALQGEYPALMRDINLRSASFNAQYAPGALLIEAGAACSHLEEAIRSIRVLGQALAKEILQQ